jgi:O-antigen biosynthesis protein
VVLSYDGSAGHSFHYAKKNAPSYFGYALLTRAVSAVTGACLVVRKDVFLEVGGLNEKNLAVAFNDVDLCLKIQTKGYRNVWTPFAKLIHHESVTRGYEDTREKKPA